MAEEWRPVYGFEETYEVSNYGRVRSRERMVAGRNGSKRRLQGQLLQPRKREDGAMAVNLWKDNRFCQRLVHRLVLESFDRPQPRGTEACHINLITHDNRRENLRWEPVAMSRRKRALRAKLQGRR
jgi:hypothetical protein